MATETQEPINVAQAKAVAWHELNVRNTEGAKNFYSSLLGWGIETYAMGEMGDYTMFKLAEGPFCGIFDLNKQNHPEIPPHWSVYFNCDDVDDTAAKAERLGGKVLAPAFDVPTVGRMCLIQDPEGATFWLFKGAPKP